MRSEVDLIRFRKAIDGLGREVDPGELVELLDSFIGDTRVRMGLLHELFLAGDHPALVRCAHSIRGSSAIFGLEDLGRSAAALESAARSPDAVGLPGLMEALRERWAELEPPIRCARLQMFHRIPPDDHLSA